MCLIKHCVHLCTDNIKTMINKKQPPTTPFTIRLETDLLLNSNLEKTFLRKVIEKKANRYLKTHIK